VEKDIKSIQLGFLTQHPILNPIAFRLQFFVFNFNQRFTLGRWKNEKHLDRVRNPTPRLKSIAYPVIPLNQLALQVMKIQST
jgi:hypothetical protein